MLRPRPTRRRISKAPANLHNPAARHAARGTVLAPVSGALTRPACARGLPQPRQAPASSSTAARRTSVTGTGLCSSSCSTTDPKPPASGSPMPRAPITTASQP